MKIIENDQIVALDISPAQCVEWAYEGFLLKRKSCMPPKTVIHLDGSLDFFGTMPCLLPKEYGRFGCKNVSRFQCSHPSVKSYLTLCDSTNGNFIALVNCDWITPMRSGAVAALAIKTFRKSDARVYSFMGLGCAGKAALRCFSDSTKNEHYEVRLLQYKDHADKTIEEFSSYKNVEFRIMDSVDSLVDGSDVVVSAITQSAGLLVNDISLFKPGVLLVPIHTRGFQNCDTVFDKIFGDDTAQISGFQFFEQFKSFGEFCDVLSGDICGRENDRQRIISYNIGLGLHDVYFAYQIEKMLKSK